MNFGFPEITDSFLSGQDILYTQFNEIEFYVEDVDQEYFYFHTLKKVFPNLAFQKIFPLNGKNNVINNADLNLGSKKKVFIVDLDFDHILNQKVEKINLFYLDRYSIENYLFEKGAIYDLIKENDPKLKDNVIDRDFNYDVVLSECKNALAELTCLFLTIQLHSLGIEYFQLNPARDFKVVNQSIVVHGTHLPKYINLIETALKKKNGRYTLQGHIKKFKKHFKPASSALKYIPGKYILQLIKYRLERTRLIRQISLDSLKIRLAKNSEFRSLQFLHDDVLAFIK